MRKWTGRIAILFLGVVLMLGLAEAGLRIAALISGSARKVSVPSGHQVIKIITVGESTTAPFPVHEPGAPGDVSWPQQLESRLNAELEGRRSKFRVHVENFGRAGVSSAFLVEAVRKRLEEGPADLLISMLGVNDVWVLIPESSFWYRHSYVGRFIYWALEVASCPACFRTEGVDKVPRAQLSARERSVYTEYSGELSKNPFNSVADIERNRATFEKLSPSMGTGVFNAVMETGWKLFDRIRVSAPEESELRKQISTEALRLLEKFHDDVIKYDNSLVLVCYLTMQQGRACSQYAETAFENGHTPSDTLLTLLVSMGEPNWPRQLPQILRARGLEVRQDIKSLEGIRQNYRRLGELLKSHDVFWMAMQYPTGTTAGLRWLMTSTPTKYERFNEIFYLENEPTSEGYSLDPLFENVVFVSNRGFQQYTRSEDASKYFRDFFARSGGLDFGHFTEDGYKVVVENLMTEIVPRLGEIEKRHQAKESPTEP